jgi:hypothetical protein
VSEQDQTIDVATLEADVAELQRIVTHTEIPSISPITFRAGELRVRDEQGPSAASIGIYNPVAARIYLGLLGVQAGPHSFPVPAESALIAPINVPGFIDLAIDEEELGEGNEATIYLLRFRTPQPFYLGSA